MTTASRKKPNPRAKTKPTSATAQSQSKLDRIVAALRARNGASVPDLMALTGWQAHSVRGALAGALKKRGLTIVLAKTGAERRYRIERAA